MNGCVSEGVGEKAEGSPGASLILWGCPGALVSAPLEKCKKLKVIALSSVALSVCFLVRVVKQFEDVSLTC